MDPGPILLVTELVTGIGEHPFYDVILLGFLFVGVWIVTTVILLVLGLVVSPRGTAFGIVGALLATASISIETGNVGLGVWSGTAILIIGIVAGRRVWAGGDRLAVTRTRAYQVLVYGSGTFGIIVGIVMFVAFFRSFLGALVPENPFVIVLFGVFAIPPVIVGGVALRYAHTLRST